MGSTLPNRPSHLKRTGSPGLWFAISGLFLGLSLHFYTASRFLPLFLAGYLVLQWALAWLTGRPEEAILPRYWRWVVLLYALAALVFFPLALYFFQHPGSFSQRASAVVAFGASNPWLRMAQAAVANLLQFFLPGHGDLAQFYNMPGRAVFEPLTAVLALVGIGVLLYSWRQPSALFLLTWWPALLLPSFLATDRFPTLPRVLGTIPAVYYYPAVGAVAVAYAITRVLRLAALRPRPGALILGLVTAAVLVHAAQAFHDYFRVWGPSPATFDAFEGDMTAAWRWLDAHPPQGHVYLSSDIYKHPTFMLLREHATVTQYFEQQDTTLSWFDARDSLPLPPPGQSATYLITPGAQPAGPAATILGEADRVLDQVKDASGIEALTVIELPAGGTHAGEPSQAIAFSDRLSLTGGTWAATPDGKPELQLRWHTSGPEPADWAGYRLEVSGEDEAGARWQVALPFESFRPPEWVAGGDFLTWHPIDVKGSSAPGKVQLRLVRAGPDGKPLVAGGAIDGWHDVDLSTSGPHVTGRPTGKKRFLSNNRR